MGFARGAGALLCLALVCWCERSPGDGTLGCLFNGSLCNPEGEWCFDDFLFGRCVSFEEDGNPDLHRYKLGEEALRLLRRELDRLVEQDFRWSHLYTQCVLKSLLHSFRHRKLYDASSCDVSAVGDGSHFRREDPRDLGPETVGQVQFTPSIVDPHAEFADEIYLPVVGAEDVAPEEEEEQEEVSDGTRGGSRFADDQNDIRRALLKQLTKRSRARDRYSIFYRPDDLSSETFAYLNDIPEDEDDDEKDRKFRLTGSYASPEGFRSGLDPKTYEPPHLENFFPRGRADVLKSFSPDYNTPDKFRTGYETRDEVVYPNGYYSPGERQLIYDRYTSDDDGADNGGVYTEGGVVYSKGEEDDGLMDDGWGFKRPERLDVKKPGPSFSTNNFAFGEGERGKMAVAVTSRSTPAGPSPSPAPPPAEPEPKVVSLPEKKKGGSPMESPSLRRQTTTVQPWKQKESGNENEYAYVTLKNRVNTWQEGSRIMRKIEEALNLRQNTFSNVRVDQNDVRFKVEPNRLNLNASEVARRIDAFKDLIQRGIGVEVVSVGVGNQGQAPNRMRFLGVDEHQLWILSFLLCGVIAAITITGAAFIFIRRHPRDKLQNLAQMDSEASKDYQDLCRARMASKTVQEKSEGVVTGHRVTSLAREGDNHSPSSRSSTSSWSEEPALTNMDISTGHMVLSYMEDHLKNKDRLEQEWIALCAYEAEPCAATVAGSEENKPKNRYPEVLPYDHARVVLKALSNVDGCDYINASTITDHDPRNPAYIATQGPLPATTADFWQMIWEQGCVVMVMLTRLSENGAILCHRYWPEEGSELYHIYEVHLVSEHIWCDDYLVRSFYLKNVETSETRTVTQFHFLSWPENGIPLSTKALLEFRRKVNKSYRGRSCPVVVHCSDGVGRTGTYCLIDMVLNRMGKGAKEIDIAATLEHIRDQRPLMVRTKQQFEFVLMAVAEEVHAILKALPANQNHSPPPVAKDKE